MTIIGILSDTHGFLDNKIITHFSDCNEVWHAGDVGNSQIVDTLRSELPSAKIRGVYGNIDGSEIRSEFPELNIFYCEKIKVMMLHIGGYPPKYNKNAKEQLRLHKPALFVTGHSHILKIIFDAELQCLHINPGAAGKQGWQKVRTIIKLVIDGKNMRDCKIIELGKK